MRFEQLRYLEAAIRTGSYRRAAAELGVSQPTIGAQIQRLEEDLGVSMLLKSSRGVQATFAAEQLLPHLRSALRAEHSLRQEASSISGVKSGRVSLGAVTSASQGIMPPLVRRFQQEYPNVRFHVFEGGSGKVLEGVADGRFDAGVLVRMTCDDVDERVRYRDIAEGRIVLSLPETHPLAGADSISGDDLAHEPIIGYAKSSLLGRATERLLAGRDVEFIYQAASSETAQLMVSAGVGLALTNTLAPSTWSHEGVVLASLPTDWAEIRMSIVTRKDEQSSPAVRTFLDLVIEDAAARRKDRDLQVRMSARSIKR